MKLRSVVLISQLSNRGGKSPAVVHVIQPCSPLSCGVHCRCCLRGRHHPDIGVFGMFPVGITVTKPNSTDVRVMYSQFTPAPPLSTLADSSKTPSVLTLFSGPDESAVIQNQSHGRCSPTPDCGTRSLKRTPVKVLENVRRRKTALEGVSYPVRYQPTAPVRTDMCRDTIGLFQNSLG